MDNLLPTTQAIIERVDEWWGIRYTVPGMYKWLHRNYFSYKKLPGVPHKLSAEAQQAFVEAYNQLKSEAGDEPILCPPNAGNETSLWMDAKRVENHNGNKG